MYKLFAKCLSTTKTKPPPPKSFDLLGLAAALPPPQFKLRDYQVEAVNSVLLALKSGVSRPAVVLATGGGKTVVIASIIPLIEGETPGRTKTLVLAHKEELIRQAAKTIREVNPGLTVDMDMLKRTPSEDADVIVGSVQTLVRMTRLTKYNPDEFKAIVLDECHHATAGSWMKILNYFNALEDLKIPVLGFTATLERADGASLGKVFQEIVYERSLLKMIRNGELCDALFSTMEVDLSLDHVKVTGGDYVPSRLAEVMNKEKINLQVTRAYIELQKEHNLKSTLVFCVDIEHCRTLCGVLQANGVNAQYVTGMTVKHERQAILDDFKAGKIQVLCNVLVFTEGTDIPNVDSLVLARPTKSRPLLTQMVGRGLRLYEGKDHCHIIDLCGTLNVGILSIPILFGLPDSHVFAKKTFKDLLNEKEELSAAELNSAASVRLQKVEEILALQREIQDLDVNFNVVDGFETRFNQKGLPSDSEDVATLFKEHHLFWVRLEYNVWGIECGTLGDYLTIERGEDESFSLYNVRLVDKNVIRASNFKSKRKYKHLVNSGSLTSLLAMASTILRTESKSYSNQDRLATKSQVAFMVSLLKRTIKSHYSSEHVETFKENAAQITRKRASNLIFAAKHSMSSLWVKWELQKLIGPSQAMLARKSRLEKTLKIKKENYQAETQRVAILEQTHSIQRLD